MSLKTGRLTGIVVKSEDGKSNIKVGNYDDNVISKSGKIQLTSKNFKNKKYESVISEGEFNFNNVDYDEYDVRINVGLFLKRIDGSIVVDSNNKYITIFIPEPTKLNVKHNVKSDKNTNPETVNGCSSLIKKYYEEMLNLNNKRITKNDINPNELKIEKENIISCYNLYSNSLDNKTKKMISDLQNLPPGDVENFFELDGITENTNIYKHMELNKIIKKVVLKHDENVKSTMSESKIIKNRLNFILEDYDLDNGSDKYFAIKTLKNEQKNLIKSGYNKDLVKENFIDVIKNLFNDGTVDVVEDVKKKLIDKIVSSIDLKSIFNEIPSSTIESALNTKNPSIISGEVADKIRTKIDEKIKSVLDDVTSKMDKKIQDIRNVVGGL
jgi:hypothetical protein